MEINTILRIVSYIVYICVLCSYPLRKKNLLRQTGKCILALSRKRQPLVYIVLICAPLLILLQRFRDLGVPINIILSGCAVLGAEVVLREYNLASLAGVYEQAVIADSRVIFFRNILALPTLAYENSGETSTEENSSSLYDRSLKIVTSHSGVIFIGFTDKSERDKAVDAICSQKPDVDTRNQP